MENSLIKKEKFRGEAAVVLENSGLRVVLLPGLGGKIASIFRKDKNFELLFQNRKLTYDKPQLYSAFEKFDASGFDDAFPSIDECSVACESELVKVPDHGEIWSAVFDCEIKRDKAIMSYKSRILPYLYKKSVCLEADRIVLRYSISNTGDFDFPCLWAMHCLIHCEEDMEILFPKGTKEILNVKKSRYLGDVGKMHCFPETRTQEGVKVRLDRIGPRSALKSEKYYVNGEVEEGLCGAYYPKDGVRFGISYDRRKLPYLGFWVTEGGFRGDYNCALEPASGFYDSIETAQRNKRIYILKKGCTLDFDIVISLS